MCLTKIVNDLTKFIGKKNILITNKNCSIGRVLGHLIDFHFLFFYELSVIILDSINMVNKSMYDLTVHISI